MVFRKSRTGSGEVIPSSNQRRQSKYISTEKHGDGLCVCPNQLCLAIALALTGPQALAQDKRLASSPEQEDQSIIAEGNGPLHELDTLNVIGVQEEENKAIGNTSGASKEDVERRGASHMTDLIDQISGVSANNLYSAPELSVRLQGIAGHGRVSQSLEGINQNFHAFTRDIGQTGSIFVNPQFLKSIDITRGGSSGTGALGSLGGSVDFKYLDLEDILRPGKNFGGMVRGSTGFSKYSNGEKPSGSFFLGGHSDRWDFMLGASRSKNDAYHIGQNFSDSRMLRDAEASNIVFFPERYYGGNLVDWEERPSTCRYIVDGLGGIGSAMRNCQFNPEQLKWLKESAKKPLKGTQKENDAQMLRLRHYLNDEYDQHLELFATTSRAKYETDQQPSIFIPLITEPGSDARWRDTPWSVKAELENTVVSLKYGASFSKLLNPTVQLYHENQERDQRWTGYPGTYSMGEALHYFVDIGSTGLKLDNSSNFFTNLLGPLRLDTGLDLRRSDKRVDSLSDAEFYEKYMHSIGNTHYKADRWDPDSHTDIFGFSLALNTEGNGPWQASAGVGYQHVSPDVLNPRYSTGNIRQGGTLYGKSYYYNQYYQEYLAQGIPRREARAMAQSAASVASESAQKEFFFDPSSGDERLYDDGKKKHEYDLKSAHFALQYMRPGSGLTTYGKIGYSERAPTSNEMYMGGPWLKTGFTANPYLNPEKNLSFQIGANYETKNWLERNDQLFVGFNYYRNHIKDYIVYGPTWRPDAAYTIDSNFGDFVSSVNNLNTFVRHGLEFNFYYKQPLFYVRSNFTLPLRHDNKICSWTSQSGRSYLKSPNSDGSTEYVATGNGERICYSSWNWMEAGAIEPIRGSLTAALTPDGGRWEIGGTMHYRGKQRAAYWFDSNLQANQTNDSAASLPDKSKFITASLWPRSIKFDLFSNYRFNDQLKVGVYLANVTDEMDATTTTFGYNFYPGRTLTANLEYRF